MIISQNGKGKRFYYPIQILTKHNLLTQLPTCFQIAINIHHNITKFNKII